MSEPALAVRDLVKSYSRAKALRGLSFEVPRGAFFGVLGRNGAGKTTTLDIVTGLLRRDSGHVTILGEELRLEPLPETKARFAYVAGHLQLYGWMTCREHIEFVSRFYPTRDAAPAHGWYTPSGRTAPDACGRPGEGLPSTHKGRRSAYERADPRGTRPWCVTRRLPGDARQCRRSGVLRRCPGGGRSGQAT
ncbi:MAG: ATP-binding cassette domain-containing protein [Armatimonadetes bacterium]|nr:ATP-binding cassette domain-containing protein [Armatimonadota bacterium]